MASDIIQVVHRDRGGVEASVCVETAQAVTQTLERDLIALVEGGQRVLISLAVERIRHSGPALIHQDNVALCLNPTKDLAELLGHLGSALAGASREKEQRIGLRIGAKSRQDNNLQIDGPAFARLAILEDPQRSAQRISWPVTGLARLESIDSGGCPVLDATRGEQE
jgi:hypothetical protein